MTVNGQGINIYAKEASASELRKEKLHSELECNTSTRPWRQNE